jgi:hypothetical protein
MISFLSLNFFPDGHHSCGKAYNFSFYSSNQKLGMLAPKLTRITSIYIYVMNNNFVKQRGKSLLHEKYTSEPTFYRLLQFKKLT